MTSLPEGSPLQKSTAENIAKPVYYEYNIPEAPAEPVPIQKVVALIQCGSFSPPTIAHSQTLIVAYRAIRSIGVTVSHIIISPVSDAYGKKSLAPAPDRIAMCKLAADQVRTQINEPGVQVYCDEWESRQPGAVRTYVVLEHFQAELGVQTLPIFGNDVLLSMLQPGVWNIDLATRLLARHHAVVVPRPDLVTTEELIERFRNEGGPLAEFVDHFHFTESLPPRLAAVSSTAARAIIANSDCTETIMQLTAGILQPQVALYIAGHGLYKNGL